MSRLSVRAYNVRFGDAILVTVPDRGVDGIEVARHILIDVGNVLSGAGGLDDMFPDVISDIHSRLDGRPLDLYVMSHEHLDHVKGLLSAANAGREIAVDHAWLPASSEPGYYQRFTKARRQKALALSTYERIRTEIAERGLESVPHVASMLANNDPSSTASCVAYLQSIARKRTTYVYRGLRLRTGVHHPFQEARLTIWAPEEDSSAYYGRLTPFSATSRKRALRPPPGVGVEAFGDLIRYLESGLGDSMLYIDRAANNTSVVFTLEWRSWRLVFPGDAELASWALMKARGVLEPVDFLKVSHHASHNGTPPDEVLDTVLPERRTGARKRVALVSTWPETYSGVPDEFTLARLRGRVDEIVSTTSVATGDAVTVEFEG